LQVAAILPAGLIHAARKEFWESKDPGAWTSEEKQVLLGQSPWAQEGFVRMEVEKKRNAPGYGRNGKQGVDMPDTRPGVSPGGVRSVPIGEPVPPVPKTDKGPPVQFRVLARWETAQPVRLAGGPEVPEMTAQFYVLRLRGLPLMPAPQSNESMLQSIKAGSRLERKGKPGIPCDHLFAGSGKESTEVLLFFSRAGDPITVADKLVTLECSFVPFYLSVKFPLKDMTFQGKLAL
jgi:hypothetical protein